MSNKTYYLYVDSDDRSSLSKGVSTAVYQLTKQIHKPQAVAIRSCTLMNTLHNVRAGVNDQIWVSPTPGAPMSLVTFIQPGFYTPQQYVDHLSLLPPINAFYDESSNAIDISAAGPAIQYQGTGHPQSFELPLNGERITVDFLSLPNYVAFSCPQFDRNVDTRVATEKGRDKSFYTMPLVNGYGSMENHVQEHRFFIKSSGDISALKITAFCPSTGKEITELRKYVLELEIYG